MADEAGSVKSGELQSSPEIRTGFIRGNGFGPKAVQYAVVNGLAIFEGDIVLGTVEEVEREAAAIRAAASGDGAEAEAGEAEAAERGLVITGAQYRWKGGTIPYTIDSGLPSPSRVTDAMRHWRERTPIRFVLRTPANAAFYPDYVRFQDDGSGCNSQVGRHGNQQNINLGSGCSTGNAIHEIGHSVGCWHEQSREDRDTFVSIQWANIQSGFSHNFDQHISDGDDVGRYDYGSIMHYPPNAFSSNGQPTIVALQPIPPGVTMGQRTALSVGDVGAVRFMYPVRTQSGFLVQSNFGTQGNFEMVVPRANGGLAHYWRNNDNPAMPWSAAIPFGGTTNYQSACLIQSNYGIPGNLEVMARTGNQLHFFWRDSGPSFTWHGPYPITTGVASNPALVQSNFGTKGNFEMVVAKAGGGLAHYWRNNDNPSMPWSGAIPFGGAANYAGVCLVQSNYGVPGNLEVMARTGNQLHFFWRDSGPSFTWHGPYPITTGVAGDPALIQSTFGTKGNFELVVAKAGGGLAHYWRNNDNPAMPWSGAASFGGTTSYGAVSLIQSNYGIPGNLEVMARTGDHVHFFWRDSGPSFTWHGPYVIV